MDNLLDSVLVDGEKFMKRIDVATPEEVLESEMAIISAAGIKVKHVGFQKGLEGGGVHMYDVIEPRLPGYNYSDGGLPTLTMEGLREKGLLQ